MGLGLLRRRRERAGQEQQMIFRAIAAFDAQISACNTPDELHDFLVSKRDFAIKCRDIASPAARPYWEQTVEMYELALTYCTLRAKGGI